MKYKIGVFGSDLPGLTDILPKAKKLGQALGKNSHEVIVVTGAGSGLPFAVAEQAAANGAEVWGFTPTLNRRGHKLYAPDDDINVYKKLIYIPAEFEFANNDLVTKKYRNVMSTATCDAGIIIAGRWGTLNEFSNLVDMNKVVGVLTGTGGVADEIPAIVKKISKEGQGQIIFNNDPKKLVEEVLKALK